MAVARVCLSAISQRLLLRQKQQKHKWIQGSCVFSLIQFSFQNQICAPNVQPYAQRSRLVNKHIHHPLFEYEEKHFYFHFCLLFFCEAKQKIEIDSFSLFELDKGLVFKFLILILSTQISFFFSTHSMKLNDQKIH